MMPPESTTVEVAKPQRSLLECGDVEATVQQQRWHVIWKRIYSPLHILCAAISAAHYSTHKGLLPSGSPLIARAKRRAARSTASHIKEQK